MTHNPDYVANQIMWPGSRIKLNLHGGSLPFGNIIFIGNQAILEGSRHRARLVFGGIPPKI